MKPTTTIALRSDPATHDNDKVKLGDMAPAFKPSESKPVKRYIATERLRQGSSGRFCACILDAGALCNVIHVLKCCNGSA